MKVVGTIWINIVGVFIAVLVYAIVLNLADATASRNLFQAVFGALILVCLYGILFWTCFVVALVGLDLLIVRNHKNLVTKLLVEWLVISTPFLYGIVKYYEWVFLVAIMAFLLTQFLRIKAINIALGESKGT
jgi:hypothetical protein